MICTVFALAITVDAEHRVRGDRIIREKHAIWRARDWLFAGLVAAVRGLWRKFRTSVSGVWRRGEARAKDAANAGNGERQGLLDGHRRTAEVQNGGGEH